MKIKEHVKMSMSVLMNLVLITSDAPTLKVWIQNQLRYGNYNSKMNSSVRFLQPIATYTC